MTAVTLTDLTQGTINGTGVFDRLMVAVKAHLDAEFKKGTIKGPEYSQVYLGQLQAVMTTSLQFLATSQKIDLEAQLMTKQIALAQAQIDQAAAQTALVNQQTANALQEHDNLIAQKCLLEAQYDNTVQSTQRVAQETLLMTQKVATEKAQILALGVDDNSVIGRQKLLYKAQTDGFQRDAEQKILSQMIQSWNTRRMTDEGVSANTDNKLDDATIGRVVDKALTGIGA